MSGATLPLLPSHAQWQCNDRPRLWNPATATPTISERAGIADVVVCSAHGAERLWAIGDEIVTTKAPPRLMWIFPSDKVLPPLEPVDGRRRPRLQLAHDNARSRASQALS